jgi:cell division transport system permease protein
MNNSKLKIMTGTVITICYIIITLSYSFLQGVTRFLERWGQTSELTIYLKHLPTIKEQYEIEKVLSSYEKEVNYEFINSEKLVENLKTELPALSQEIEKNSELISFLPAHFVVTANSSIFGFNPTSLFNQIIDGLKPLTIVSEMTFGEPWLKKYSQFLTSIKGLSLFIYLALCLALALVVGNSIRSSINSKKDEIEILELIGATPEMIRRPFLKEGALISFTSMLIALLISSLILTLLVQVISKSYAIFGLQIIVQPLKIKELVFFTMTSLALGLFGSYWVIKSYTDGFLTKRR